jgi:Trypsin
MSPDFREQPSWVQEAIELEPIFAREKGPAPLFEVPGSLSCPSESRYTASGFPRYHNTVRSLPPAEQSKIAAVARLIAASFRPGCRPIRAVRLVGHADRDLQRGPVFEKQISEARAARVQLALKKLIGHPTIVSRIVWQPAGIGATALVLRNPRTEEERARNRRVDIFLSTVPVEGGYAVLVRHPTLGYVWTASRRGPAAAAIRGQGEGPINILTDPAPVLDSQNPPFKWICFLETDFGAELTTDGTVTGKRIIVKGTGTLISPRHILTAGHVLLSRGPMKKDIFGQPVVQLYSALSVTVIPGRDGGKVPPLEPQGRISVVDSRLMRTSQQWRSSNAGSYGSDFGLITLATPLPRTYGFWTNDQIRTLATPALQGKLATSSGYRAAQYCTPPDPVDAVRCADPGTVQYRMRGNITHVDPENIETDMTSEHGDSGGPVWLQLGTSPPVMVGIQSTRAYRGPAVAVRIRAGILSELRSWMAADRVRTSF